MKNLFFFLLATIILVACDCCEPELPKPPVKVKQFTITTLVGQNGTITPTNAIVDSLGSATFTITPKFGYVIDTIRNNGKVLPNSDKFTFRDISQNETLSVSFKFTFEKGTTEWFLCQYVWTYADAIVYDYKVGYYVSPKTNISIYEYNPNFTYTIDYLGYKYIDQVWSLDKSKDPMLFKKGAKKDAMLDYYIISINEKELFVKRYQDSTPGKEIFATSRFTNDGKLRFP
jgi:hypothetical protein